MHQFHFTLFRTSDKPHRSGMAVVSSETFTDKNSICKFQTTTIGLLCDAISFPFRSLGIGTSENKTQSVFYYVPTEDRRNEVKNTSSILLKPIPSRHQPIYFHSTFNIQNSTFSSALRAPLSALSIFSSRSENRGSDADVGCSLFNRRMIRSAHTH
jgi:hypothetical protein